MNLNLISAWLRKEFTYSLLHDRWIVGLSCLYVYCSWTSSSWVLVQGMKNLESKHCFTEFQNWLLLPKHHELT